MLSRLAEAHPESVSQLTYQYRMHASICKLSNDIAYNGKLKCANAFVANRKLQLIGFPENLPQASNQGRHHWLLRTLDPAQAVVFLDTDTIKCTLPGEDMIGKLFPLERSTSRQSGGGSIVNDTEALLVNSVVKGFLACGLDASDLGVICPYRAQLRLLGEIESFTLWKQAGLECSTIDRYQGRDKPVIVLSFVRSNIKGNVGRLLEDFRRLNVAVTRAKCKLIMIGSYSTLYHSRCLQPVLDRVKKEGQVLQLPENAAMT
jgi:DNA replication ATP-dependent helicase Dna2